MMGEDVGTALLNPALGTDDLGFCFPRGNFYKPIANIYFK